VRSSRGMLGIALGLAAGLAFGAGGVFVKPLLESGWSPGAAVLARISVAAVILAVPGLIALRFDLRPLWQARWTVLVYGLVAVAGVQFAFYASLERIPVSTTLLIEYLAPIALVLFA
jgi:drug/metabolite transporter (DMT)-like permease